MRHVEGLKREERGSSLTVYRERFGLLAVCANYGHEDGLVEV